MNVTSGYLDVSSLNHSGDHGTLLGGTTLTYFPTYATEAQVQALETENKKLRARMKRLEKLVAAALIRVDEED